MSKYTKRALQIWRANVTEFFKNDFSKEKLDIFVNSYFVLTEEKEVILNTIPQLAEEVEESFNKKEDKADIEININKQYQNYE